MDNVLIVVEDLDAAIAFFLELGMELEGRMPIEGQWVDRVIAIDDTRAEIATLRTPDGHGRIELDKFHAPEAVTPEPKVAPVNTLGLRRIMFAVDDIHAVLARLQAHGAELNTLGTTQCRTSRDTAWRRDDNTQIPSYWSTRPIEDAFQGCSGVSRPPDMTGIAASTRRPGRHLDRRRR
jgi:catechol 2,3-dioxygenase-like lactoylglutathione lyase family enzyme